MIINSNPSRNEYVATLNQTVFDYTFSIFEDVDLKVYVTPVGQIPDDATYIRADYTVTGVGEENGGTIAFDFGLNLDDYVVIVGDLAFEKTTDFGEGGDWSAESLNFNFDRNVALSKQNDTNSDSLTPRFLNSLQSSLFDTTIPAPVADSVLKINAAGDGFEFFPQGGVIAAASVSYDNSGTSFISGNVQGALTEADTRLSNIEGLDLGGIVDDAEAAAAASAASAVDSSNSATAADSSETGADAAAVVATTEAGNATTEANRAEAAADQAETLAGLAGVAVGQIVWFPADPVTPIERPGALRPLGQTVSRSEFDLLWAALLTGILPLVTQAEWNAGQKAVFGDGDGSTTFTIPKIDGYYIRTPGAEDPDFGSRLPGDEQEDTESLHDHASTETIAVGSRPKNVYLQPYVVTTRTSGLSQGVILRGTWDASTNTVFNDPLNSSITKGVAPVVEAGLDPDGFGFLCIIGGTIDIDGSPGAETYFAGDQVVWADPAWVKLSSGGVTSVNSRTGDVVGLAETGLVNTFTASNTFNVPPLTLADPTISSELARKGFVDSADAATLISANAYTDAGLALKLDSGAKAADSSLLDGFDSTEFVRTGVANDFTVPPTINGNEIWHAGNDGAGSGLDADLLDGQQGSFYTLITNQTGTLPVVNGGTGVTTATGSGSTVRAVSPNLTGTPTVSGNDVLHQGNSLSVEFHATSAAALSASQGDGGAGLHVAPA
jgi:hypothetical protein